MGCALLIVLGVSKTDNRQLFISGGMKRGCDTHSSNIWIAATSFFRAYKALDDGIIHSVCGFVVPLLGGALGL